MSASTLVVRTGIGSWSAIKYIPTHGLAIGAAAPVSTAPPKLWALLCGFGRHAIQGNKGYSR